MKKVLSVFDSNSSARKHVCIGYPASTFYCNFPYSIKSINSVLILQCEKKSYQLHQIFQCFEFLSSSYHIPSSSCLVTPDLSPVL